ncbi:carbohydrate ABC transporter permease [Occultella aeris]|uniref:Maltose transport system permease protein MalG n=1 Tax=Occultella aeris TaxID=2761496 RepID=A0A7M4DGH9_9MICO|nr:carbohydrate ABC transporter permease [Occultella aeris]VZO36022.1 Maltose transport system permease protein MalG [Occultella aeris]
MTAPAALRTADPQGARAARARPAKRPTKRSTPLRTIAWHGLMVLICVVSIYPLLWMARSSVVPENEIFSSPSVIPSGIDLSNYPAGWVANPPGFGQFMLNSFVICVGAVLGNLIACTLAAYAFARLRFPLKGLWFTVMLGTMMLPGHVTLIPQYALFSAIDWVGTYLPLIVPKFLATDAFFIFLLVQFMRGIPRELDEAAEIDGAGRWRTFRSVMLPLTVPALATTAVFTFIWTYEDFLGPLIYLSDLNAYPVPLGLRMFVNAMGNSSYGQLFAMSLLSLLPVFVTFLLFQRKLIQGIATTGLKG